jgi:hypothetical protein
MIATLRSNRRSEAAQVLPLFALFITVLFGMAALAIDISRAYSDLRFYRSSADAASLAGAQDLQTTGSRAVNPADRTNARTHALQSLEQRLNGGAASSCGPTSANIVDCPLGTTGFLVSIKTPSPSCSTCDPNRSVQVTVRNPNYGLSFARLFGSNEWNVGTTSVSGLVYGSQYAVITLRPPKALGATFDVKDIVLNGTGTTVTVRNGDVGSNSNMELNGSGAAVNLDPGFKVFHFDDPPMWVGAPDHQKINSLIPDPNYVYPSFAGAPTFSDSESAAARVDGTDPDCAAEIALAEGTYTILTTTPPDKVFCYNPGIYFRAGGPNTARIVVQNDEVALLKPGAYYLRKGIDIRNPGHLIGGYEADAPGVALVFDECQNVACNFDGTAAEAIALNAGEAFPPGTAGPTAAAAIDWAGNQVITSGPASPIPPLIMTVMVLKDTSCFVPTSPPWQEPPGCNATQNQTLNMAGGGSLALVGVQYAPTDNVKISGGSSGNGEVGQIISWTLTYDGGTHINQHYPGNTGNGILRIDAACSAPGEPCNP